MNYIVKPVSVDYITYKGIIEELLQNFSFLSVNVIGRTALDRGIFSLDIGNSKNSVLYVAGFCGDEGLTSLMALLFAERVCRSISEGNTICGIDMGRALTQLGITVVPCLNPDGIEIFRHGEVGAKTLRTFIADTDGASLWKANALGVDIRRNFNRSSDSTITKPSCEGYGGEHSGSEAETKALSRLCRLRPFRQAMSIHKGHDCFMWQEENSPSHSRMMAKILSAYCSCTLNNKPESSPNYGFPKWFTDRFCRPAFALEAEGEEADLFKVYARFEEALVLLSLM